MELVLLDRAKQDLEFDINLLTAFAVEIKKCTSQKGEGHKSEDTSLTVAATSQNNCCHKSGNEEKHPFGKNILTLNERIIDFCSTPKSMQEIADLLGVKDKRRAREHFIDPQLGITLERTIPDKPTSRFQKYVAIKNSTSHN